MPYARADVERPRGTMPVQSRVTSALVIPTGPREPTRVPSDSTPRSTSRPPPVPRCPSPQVHVHFSGIPPAHSAVRSAPGARKTHDHGGGGHSGPPPAHCRARPNGCSALSSASFGISPTAQSPQRPSTPATTPIVNGDHLPRTSADDHDHDRRTPLSTPPPHSPATLDCHPQQQRLLLHANIHGNALPSSPTRTRRRRPARPRAPHFHPTPPAPGRPNRRQLQRHHLNNAGRNSGSNTKPTADQNTSQQELLPPTPEGPRRRPSTPRRTRSTSCNSPQPEKDNTSSCNDDPTPPPKADLGSRAPKQSAPPNTARKRPQDQDHHRRHSHAGRPGTTPIAGDQKTTGPTGNDPALLPPTTRTANDHHCLQQQRANVAADRRNTETSGNTSNKPSKPPPTPATSSNAAKSSSPKRATPEAGPIEGTRCQQHRHHVRAKASPLPRHPPTGRLLQDLMPGDQRHRENQGAGRSLSRRRSC